MTDYTVRYSGRKTLALEITREGALLVRAPMRCTEREISAMLTRHAAWIEKHQAAARKRAETYPEPSAEEAAKLRERAKAELPGRVAFYARVMGLEPAGITITGAKTRFGSCSGKNRLSFSWRLMRYPQGAIDYVVVHELAHIRHKNHSREFYALIEGVLPDYRARQKLLKG